jgi:short-subunit dehydrogenase
VPRGLGEFVSLSNRLAVFKRPRPWTLADPLAVLPFSDANTAAPQARAVKPVVVVAGAGPGIGASAARAFGAEGFSCALFARDSARLESRCAELTAAGIVAASFVVDLADPAATGHAVEQVRTWAGGDPSALVYNAFMVQQGSADQLDMADSQRAMRINFIAATQLTALLAPAMRASGTGSLLFTGGGLALHPCAGLSSLCAGKAALRMWALTLAEDLAGTGVRVGTVTVHGEVRRGTAFDPDHIAAALMRLHRGTHEGFEIHFK